MSDAPENVPAGSNPVSGPALKNLPWYMNVCEAKMSCLRACLEKSVLYSMNVCEAKMSCPDLL